MIKIRQIFSTEKPLQTTERPTIYKDRKIHRLSTINPTTTIASPPAFTFDFTVEKRQWSQLEERQPLPNEEVVLTMADLDTLEAGPGPGPLI